jgi:NADPH:quinone reductase-like Zn-dependent oxidoreductase
LGSDLREEAQPGLTMNIAITGANSAVGQAILRLGRQEEAAMAFVAAVRSERAAQHQRPDHPNRG